MTSLIFRITLWHIPLPRSRLFLNWNVSLMCSFNSVRPWRLNLHNSFSCLVLFKFPKNFSAKNTASQYAIKHRLTTLLHYLSQPTPYLSDYRVVSAGNGDKTHQKYPFRISYWTYSRGLDSSTLKLKFRRQKKKPSCLAMSPLKTNHSLYSMSHLW